DVRLSPGRAVPRRGPGRAQRAEGFVRLMDFFAAEQRARKRTARLLVLFGFAVAGTVFAGYAATIVGLRVAGHQARLGSPYGYRGEDSGAAEEEDPFW